MRLLTRFQSQSPSLCFPHYLLMPLTRRDNQAERLCIRFSDSSRASIPAQLGGYFRAALRCMRTMQISRDGLNKGLTLIFLVSVWVFFFFFFFHSGAALCDLRGSSVICYSGAFWVSVFSVLLPADLPPCSDPGSASFNGADCPGCVSLSRSLCGGGFSYTRSAALNVSVSYSWFHWFFHSLKA